MSSVNAQALAIFAEKLDASLGEVALISDGLPSRVLEQGQAWAEAGDPERCLAELYGYRLTPDSKRWLYALEESPRVLGIGAHDCSKTHIGGAWAQGWRFYAQGCLPDGAGDVRGCMLGLLSGRRGQTMRTSYKALLDHAARARSRGYEIPGHAGCSDRTVLWRQHATRWLVTDEAFKRPAKGADAGHVSQAAGLKHPYNLVIWVEEADHVDEVTWTTVMGWNPESVFGCLNPYTASGATFQFTEGNQWGTVAFSWLRHPSVLERRLLIPGGCSHQVLESELRDPTRVQRLGLAGEIEPDAGKHDFAYALPDPEEPGWAGEPVEVKTDDGEVIRYARDDHVPGHPAAQVQIFRPSNAFIAGRIGEYPPGSPSLVFSAPAWRDGVELRRSLRQPDWLPEAVGGDMAEGGPDRIVFTPRWGRSAREIWERYQTELATGISFAAARDLALKCGACDGAGTYEEDGEEYLCDCWDGKLYCYIGEPVTIPKTDDLDELSGSIVALFGATTYHLDQSAGGHWLKPALERLGCKAVLVPFNAAVPQQLPGQKPFFNQRSFMYGQLAETSLIGAVAFPEDSEVRAGCRVLEWESLERAEAGGRVGKLNIQDKTAVKAKLGGQSPDPADSAALTEACLRGEAPRFSVYPGMTVGSRR